jgi:hypothetical protein
MESTTRLAPDRAGLVVLAVFALLTLDVVNLFPQFRSPNEFSRYALVVSMAERHRLDIDRELTEFGNHEDKSSFAGHFYSNKAPGLAFAALPVYVALRPLLGPATPDHFRAMFYLLRVGTVSLACFVALVVLRRRLRVLAEGSGAAPFVLLAVAFATPFGLYARSFFSHAWTASLLYLAFELIERPSARAWQSALAGVLAGWAVLSEYPAALVAVALLLRAFSRGPRRGILFAAGALPAAVLLGAYDRACFGGIFELSSRHEASAEYRSLGERASVGFGPPRPWIAAEFLFSESRGVLFESPIFLFLPFALARRRGELFCAATTAVFFLVMCGYVNWHGGWSLGPRYLLPVLLLAAWPLASWNPGRPARAAAAAAVVFSAAFFFLGGATFWFLPHRPFPTIRFFSAWFLARGWIVPTWLGGTPAALGLPLAATVVATVFAVGAWLPRSRDRWLAGGAGLALFCLLFAGPPPAGTFSDRLVRAKIFSVDSGLDPDRAELRALASEARTESDRSSLAAALGR